MGGGIIVIIIKDILVCSILSCIDPDQSVGNYSGVLSEFASVTSKINLYQYLNACFPAKADSEVEVVTIIKQRLVKTSLKIN